jgi:hypothetical protein
MEHYHHQPTTDLFLEEPVVYAGFWERFGAAFIDGLVLMIPNLLLQYAAGTAGMIISIFLPWIYSALM